ncbi:MAG TPA: hypothetical protein VFZ69_02260 [Longimicrobiales bacterium]
MARGRPGRVARGTVVLLALLFIQCSKEQLTIDVRGDFTIGRETGETAALLMEGRLYDEQTDRQSFNDAWAVVTRGAAPYEAIALTLTSVSDSGDPVPLLAGLVIAIPTPLRTGASYTIGAAFPPPPDLMPMYWSIWGRRDLAAPATAEIALRTFDYHTVGMTIENEFIATAAAGSIQVLRARDDYVDLRLDLTATNAAGADVHLSGDVSIRAERYRPPIS